MIHLNPLGQELIVRETMAEILARLRRQLAAPLVSCLEARAAHNTARRAGSIRAVDPLAKFLSELIRPLISRLSILEMGVPILSHLLGERSIQLELDDRGQTIFSETLLLPMRKAVTTFRRIVLDIAERQLGLQGSERMSFLREAVRVESPFVHGTWRESAPADLQGEGWSLVLETLFPDTSEARRRLLNLDICLAEFWKECLRAENSPLCKFGAKGLVEGRWRLNLNRKDSAMHRQSGLRCVLSHDCRFGGLQAVAAGSFSSAR